MGARSSVARKERSAWVPLVECLQTSTQSTSARRPTLVSYLVHFDCPNTPTVFSVSPCGACNSGVIGRIGGTSSLPHCSAASVAMLCSLTSFSVRAWQCWLTMGTSSPAPSSTDFSIKVGNRAPMAEAGISADRTGEKRSNVRTGCYEVPLSTAKSSVGAGVEGG